MKLEDAKLGMKVRNVDTHNESVIIDIRSSGLVTLKMLKTGRRMTPSSLLSYIPFRYSQFEIVEATYDAFAKAQ